ncbi:MAG: exodeoxyribonuclease I [Pseudomonadota bacterium]
MSKAIPQSFYWHDYETFGTDPAGDRAAQFAGVRTDADLNVIGEPLLVYCKPSDDYLPSPRACAVTGITPQHAQTHGIIEPEFIKKIHAELAQPGTCTVGYNNIRFDDEFTRFALYRNFFDAYAREWQNGNSRWDLLDVVRMTRALRPDGIEWPVNEDGSVSNRLEHLTAANGLRHEAAHDALSDVYATIDVARLIRDKQPRLYSFLLENRSKQPAAAMLNVRDRNMLVHSSGRIPNDSLNTTVVLPICRHPVNKNGVIVFDLRGNPNALIEFDSEDIADRVFTPVADLPEGEERIPLKQVHTNKCPVLAPINVLDAASAERIGIDKIQCEKHRELLIQNIDAVAEKISDVFASQAFEPITDPDRMLYSGGFFSADDRRKMDSLRSKTPQQLASDAMMFDDGRIAEMLFRYRARNFGDTLSADEKREWSAHCHARFYEQDGYGQTAYEKFLAELNECRSEMPEKSAVFDELMQFVESIRPAA